MSPNCLPARRPALGCLFVAVDSTGSVGFANTKPKWAFNKRARRRRRAHLAFPRGYCRYPLQQLARGLQAQACDLRRTPVQRNLNYSQAVTRVPLRNQSHCTLLTRRPFRNLDLDRPPPRLRNSPLSPPNSLCPLASRCNFCRCRLCVVTIATEVLKQAGYFAVTPELTTGPSTACQALLERETHLY